MSPAAMRSVAVAAKGKGVSNLARRARSIGTHYGLSPRRMERRLNQVLELIERYGCGATLPVTAAAVERHPQAIARYAEHGIEFAVHGYHHVDHAGLSAEEQIAQLGRARQILEANGIRSVGFRAPYLRWNEGTMLALRENGYLYDSSQAMSWPIDLDSDTYRRALAFYDALPAGEHPVVPRLDDGIVRIPCTLPDDEAVIDRLGLTSAGAIRTLWLDILRRTHERGELFTLAVHPERIEPCAPAVAAVLEEARALRPGVWLTRLDQVARWWRERTATVVDAHDGNGGRTRVSVRGPDGLTILTRDVTVDGAEPWSDNYRRLHSLRFELRTDRRPFIGVHPASSDRLATFLQEQGYIVQSTDSATSHTCFLRRERFLPKDELPLLEEIEAGKFPLLRLGRWPDGARSALAVTGDVDGLTIWDYAFRLFGR